MMIAQTLSFFDLLEHFLKRNFASSIIWLPHGIICIGEVRYIFNLSIYLPGFSIMSCFTSLPKMTNKVPF